MPTSRYEQRFAVLRSRGEGAFVPFTVLGDPDPEISLDILRALVAGGADMLELGIAFSDPIADGPTIQSADRRVLAGSLSPDGALNILAAFRREFSDVPVGLLLYANLIHSRGLAAFYQKVARAGADSVLVADLPLEESAPFRRAARAAGVASVNMVTPTTPGARLDRILTAGGPYLYVVSRLGVTGRDRNLAASAGPLLDRVRRRSRIPTLIGFGVSAPVQVRQAIAAGADGAISGSAIVAILTKHWERGVASLGKRSQAAMLEELRDFVGAMKKATRR